VNYLDLEPLRNLSREEFLAARPYPYLDEPVLTAAGFEDLLGNMPDLELFEQKFGYARRAGQAPHDRYSLEYDPDVPVPAPWHEFIAELRSDAYRKEVARLFGARKIEFRCHWHYTPGGAGVSPHCDARRELGSHIFYFNSAADWDPAWGGATLVLDDGGRLHYNSAPALDDFADIVECKFLGNASALLLRTDHSWHAVRPIACPPDRLRRVFIVVVNPDSAFWKVRDRLVGKKIQRL